MRYSTFTYNMTLSLLIIIHLPLYFNNTIYLYIAVGDSDYDTPDIRDIVVELDDDSVWFIDKRFYIIAV